jgi:enoyl-CoA hydratase
MPVKVEHDGRGVATIILDRPEKLNALDSETLIVLAEHVTALVKEPGTRVLVLRGAGERAFVGGADVREMAALSGPEQARAFITRVHRACDALRRAPVPVIARLNGHVLGAGLEIAASCDLRVADRSALFGMPEVRIGLPSVVEAALLPRLIGWGRANRLLLTGETIGADQALAWGLVEEVTETGALDAAISRLADAILASGSQAIRLQKQLIAEWEGLPLAEAVRRGIDCFETAWQGEEPRRMLDAHVAAMRARKARA